MNTTVRLPDGTSTSPLGVGMATLMREPSPRRQQRLLEAAFDVGFRYVDTAPSYGLGAAEGALGRFLKGRREDVAVATKFGLEVTVPGPLTRLAQRPARMLLKRFPGLRGAATQSVGQSLHRAADFSVEAAEQSLAQSLTALGTDYVDVLHLHEVRSADELAPPLLDWLGRQRERGRVRHVGVATTVKGAVAVVGALPGRFDAVQAPSGVLQPAGPALDALDVPLRVTHGVFTPALGVLTERAQEDAAWARGLSDAAGADIRQPHAVPRLLLALALDETPGGVVLVGSSTEANIRSAAGAVGAFPPETLDRARSYIQRTVA